MSQVEGSYEAEAAYNRDQARHRTAEPAPAFGGLPKDPGPAFGRMRDSAPGEAGPKTDGAKDAGPEAAGDPPVLPVLAGLVRKAAERCEAEAKNYRDTAGSQAPTAPVSFMRSLGMILSVAADSMDDLADEL